jgi:hypothetical protein
MPNNISCFASMREHSWCVREEHGFEASNHAPMEIPPATKFSLTQRNDKDSKSNNYERTSLGRNEVTQLHLPIGGGAVVGGGHDTISTAA